MMAEKPHIVRLVAAEARRQFYQPRTTPAAPLRPRVLDDEIGVELDDGRFVPYADLGYHSDIGFFCLSETDGVVNEAAPYAASGRLIDCGQVLVATGVSQRLTQPEIISLIERHASGDFGQHGDFYDLDVTDAMLCDGPPQPYAPGHFNKANTLTGLAPIVSSYAVRDHTIWVITEAGEKRTTLLVFAGTLPD